jgi:predicted anti-sigma-YlaC factor YlaD
VRGAGGSTGHVRILLGVFLLGGLSAEEECAVRAHLQACAECRAEHDYLACVPQWLDLAREETADDGPMSGDVTRGGFG